ncbi:ABC-type nitrate/sulfonate/bicarbonate transport system, ATPase component [Paraburkholderia fungorum]|uniref:ABC-type nitrate/sulfonate/bicarbonate transport system, ATPase component n=1 Tax=Paraburkholderia fungorum TaxID=134537 RepID=A0A1H1JBR3_9BURK|nr:ABC transporter ATP-binding protein [Paraburkholderia fungorum]SDR47371.1 ABC-type nitrate/sulfonate/bicarbonate transport system, ATPase component [Paraburkholderia fungorum]
MSVNKIELLGVRKSFALGKNAVRDVVSDVSFKARPGEFVSVIGPSGCGKSTVFNIMAGLEPPSSGHVLVDGRDRTGDCTPFAYMPQKDLLFPWRTILQNTTLGLELAGVKRKDAQKKARELFPAFGLAGFENNLPFELSGGMRQRAAFLRTVVLGRDILLLDEPFGALDSLTRIEMQNWLQEVWSQHAWTAVMITHDIHEAIFLSDRVVVLGARPTSVKLDLRIDLPRPRTLAMSGSREFGLFEEQLLETLHEESRKALAVPAALDAA